MRTRAAESFFPSSFGLAKYEILFVTKRFWIAVSFDYIAIVFCFRCDFFFFKTTSKLDSFSSTEKKDKK
jgi:hypothetical protein